MLKYAENKDKSEILNLFNICFPNEEEFAEYFFKHFFSPENTVICVEDGKIAGSAMELKYDISGVGEVTYLYAVGTLPEYRGRGLCKSILDYSHREDIKKGRAASVLIPGNSSLFDFYARYGYKTCFYVDEHKLTYKNAGESYDFGEPTGKELEAVYELFLKNKPHIIRDAAYFDVQKDMFKRFGGGVKGVYEGGRLKGYCFYSVEDGKIIFEEAMGELCEIAANEILREKNLDEGIMRGTGKGKAFGMAYFYGNSFDDMYMNLMFN